MLSSTISGFVIPYLPIDSLVPFLHSHKYDPDHEVIIRNHCFFRDRYIPDNCNYSEFYNYIKYYYLISRFHCIDSTKRLFIIQFYLNNYEASNNKLEDPRGCPPSNADNYYYCVSDGYWKYHKSEMISFMDKPWAWGLESVQKIPVVPFPSSLDHIVQQAIPDEPWDWGLESVQEIPSSLDHIVQQECQLPYISSSKCFRSQNRNHQKRLRKQLNRKQLNRTQFNRKQFNRKQFNRKR